MTHSMTYPLHFASASCVSVHVTFNCKYEHVSIYSAQLNTASALLNSLHHYVIPTMIAATSSNQRCPYLLGDFASLISKNRYPRCQWANSLVPSKAKQGPRSSGWYRYTHSSPATMNWESWEGSAREEQRSAQPCVSSSTLGYSLMDKV